MPRTKKSCYHREFVLTSRQAPHRVQKLHPHALTGEPARHLLRENSRFPPRAYGLLRLCTRRGLHQYAPSLLAVAFLRLLLPITAFDQIIVYHILRDLSRGKASEIKAPCFAFFLWFARSIFKLLKLTDVINARKRLVNLSVINYIKRIRDKLVVRFTRKDVLKAGHIS